MNGDQPILPSIEFDNRQRGGESALASAAVFASIIWT
jgi:hypothetical protein